MGTKERKIKEKEDLKALILQGAKKLFVEQGIAHTTIRSIANLIDYSVGTVYVYFKDKNAILHALHTQGFTQLSTGFRVLTHVGNPMERLIAMGRVYIAFAVENPDMYDLMFSLRAPMDYLDATADNDWDEGKATFGGLKATVEACIQQQYFKGHAAEPLAFMIWSLVHGMCSLHISNRTCGVNLHDPAHIVDQAFDEFLMILKKL